MKYFLMTIAFSFITFTTFSQSVADSISTIWTKYLIVNDSNQVLLRYDKSYNAWELEGVGYEGPITLKNLMDSVALYLGFRYDSYKLGGIFSYQKPNRYRVTVKHVYVVHFTGYLNGNSFSDTSRTRWFSLEEARKIIPYPTMVMILEQITKHPNTVWAGAFEEYNYEPPSATKWRIIEPFYKLN